jgi:hypothetical protein
VYVIAKGKDHKQYEYGNKVSIVSTKDTNIIVGKSKIRFKMSDNRLNRHSSFTQFALFVSLITIVSLKGFFRQDDVCTEHYLCTNIASVAYRLFSFVDLDGWKNGWFWFVWSGF